MVIRNLHSLVLISERENFGLVCSSKSRSGAFQICLRAHRCWYRVWVGAVFRLSAPNRLELVSLRDWGSSDRVVVSLSFWWHKLVMRAVNRRLNVFKVTSVRENELLDVEQDRLLWLSSMIAMKIVSSGVFIRTEWEQSSWTLSWSSWTNTWWSLEHVVFDNSMFWKMKNSDELQSFFYLWPHRRRVLCRLSLCLWCLSAFFLLWRQNDYRLLLPGLCYQVVS